MNLSHVFIKQQKTYAIFIVPLSRQNKKAHPINLERGGGENQEIGGRGISVDAPTTGRQYRSRPSPAWYALFYTIYVGCQL